MDSRDIITLAFDIKHWATELGLSACAITDTELGEHETYLLNWLDRGFHGEMSYMQHHGTLRSRPAELHPGTLRIVSVRLDYRPPASAEPFSVLNDTTLAYVSRYALGRDYHKMLRQRLQRLANRIEERIGPFGYRAFVDSAPVLEKAIAQKAGLGWIGKHSNLLNDKAGSWFFLGELFVDLPLPVDPPQSTTHCGSCTACIQACPTDAIVGARQVDARRCISYHTIELHGPIPREFRRAMGNRIYGCDDCQLVCPFNKFSTPTTETDFLPKHGLDATSLVGLFAWDETTFLKRFEGSPIRRIGWERWMRNIAVALGNSRGDRSIDLALAAQASNPSELIREHVLWAIEERAGRASDAGR